MKLHIRVDDPEEGDPPVSTAQIEKLESVLEEELPLLYREIEKYAQVEVSVSFLSVDEMREVNKNHRGVDEPTDVLTFPLWEEEGCFKPSVPFCLLPLGDILICQEEAEREHALGRVGTLCLMLAHGFLHLMGWDHDTPEKELKMWERQGTLGLKLSNAMEVLQQ